MKTNGMKKADLIKAAFKHEYNTVEELAEVQAMEHTIANLGQAVEDFMSTHSKPQDVVKHAFLGMREAVGSELGDDAQGVDEEKKDWFKEATKNAKAVKAKGLPLTLENTRHAFERTGPFATKKK